MILLIMKNKHFIFLLFIILIGISLTCCKTSYLLERGTKKGKDINISNNNNIHILFYKNQGQWVQDKEYISNKERNSTNAWVTIRYAIIDNKEYNANDESYTFVLFLDYFNINKIELNKIIFHTKNKSFNLRNFLEAACIVSYHEFPNVLEFNDDDILLLRNNGIIDINNNIITKNKEQNPPDLILRYEGIDNIIKNNRKFSIEIDMTFETEDGKKEDITLNLKFKYKIVLDGLRRINDKIGESVVALVFVFFNSLIKH